MQTRPRASGLLIFFCSILISLASASVLTISIPASHILPNPNALPGSTHATLTTLPSSSSSSSAAYLTSQTPLKARLTRSSTLVFPDLATRSSAGSTTTTTSYLLDIHSREFVFAPFRVDVDAHGKVVGVWETFRGHPWGNKGPEKFAISSNDNNAGSQRQDVVVEARVLGKREFYETRKTCTSLPPFLAAPIPVYRIYSVVGYQMDRSTLANAV